MSIAEQVESAFASLAEEGLPHVAEKIEPGAILYSSWGYDQTNVDFYVVTRVTESSAWIVPMSAPVVEQTGFMSENVVAGEPLSHTGYCECRHHESRHQLVASTVGPNYHVCNGWEGGEACPCREVRLVPIKPKMHRIKRYTYGGETREVLRLTSYSSAYLWEGRKLYASHYA